MTRTLTKNTSWNQMRRGINIKSVTIISCLNSFLFEIFIHEDCALPPSSQKSFCCGQHSSFKHLPSQKNSLFLAWRLGAIVSRYKEVWFSIWFQIGSHEVFGLVSTCHFRLFIFGRSPILWFCSFNNILFIVVKGHNFLNIILW
jgi:hypothetical protein